MVLNQLTSLLMNGTVVGQILYYNSGGKKKGGDGGKNDRGTREQGGNKLSRRNSR